METELDFDDFDIGDFDFGMDFNLELDFDLSDFSLEEKADNLETRIMPPKVYKDSLRQKIKYQNAKKLASDIDIGRGTSAFVIVAGNFIFGDFIEALVDERKLQVKKIYISTLSISEDNIDSLKNIMLMSGNRLRELNIILSNYFYSHEKHNLVPYLYQELDIENKLQVAICASHCKICLIETHSGEYYVMHGSANLRSSMNIEQFCFEEDKDLYEFNQKYMDAIIEKYKTINKTLIGAKLWQAVAGDNQKEKSPG